jgi:beta-phosphoglucomutase family hydrolase
MPGVVATPGGLGGATNREGTMDGRGPIDAVVFDLDGVVTRTAGAHRAAWRTLFDGFLRGRAGREGTAFEPFTDADYRTHVDGRPRPDGVRTFLAARGIELPEGSDDDPPGADTVTGLGRRKNELFGAAIRDAGVEVDAGAVRFVGELRGAGIPVGVASSSRNARLVLETAGLADLFEARVDGEVSARLGLAGKPAPDIFLACLHELGVDDPARAVVLEDAVAGVEAGRAGGFGLVIGVDRGDSAAALREHGADWVIQDFAEVTLDRVARRLRERSGAGAP